ncbi:MAG: TIGR04282 family arsenosugar biosynthesis glycosyltransferase [Croceitalea sp.]|nr:TIGR04282 family arsenosugar biosynthesis glycosyltransferase [Croceitalea sp.]
MKTDSNKLLLIFTRNPELGKCKTRLAKVTGDIAALEIYKFLLKHTHSITKNLDVHKTVYYSENIWLEDIWSKGNFEKKLQNGKDLGERMANAFKDGFASNFEKIIIIGSDLYDLSQNDFENAFGALENHDFVVGPAIDGGFYLLGMKVFKNALFHNKVWGTSSVLEKTLKDLEGENFHLLESRNDVDHFEDIKDIEAFKPFIKHI